MTLSVPYNDPPVIRPEPSHTSVRCFTPSHILEQRSSSHADHLLFHALYGRADTFTFTIYLKRFRDIEMLSVYALIFKSCFPTELCYDQTGDIRRSVIYDLSFTSQGLIAVFDTNSVAPLGCRAMPSADTQNYVSCQRTPTCHSHVGRGSSHPCRDDKGMKYDTL